MDRRAVERAGRDRRARARVNDVADRRRYADTLRAVAQHRGLGQWPEAVTHLLNEAERIDAEARRDLARAMAAAGAVVAARKEN